MRRALFPQIPARTRAIIGYGGGKALDVAKYVAFLTRVPYLAVPASLSNDGFCSPQSSLTLDVGAGPLVVRLRTPDLSTAAPEAAAARCSLRAVPNPFNPRTEFVMSLPRVGKAEVLTREGCSIYVGDHVHDVEGALARLSDDIDYIAAAPIDILPHLGHRRGKAEIRKMWQTVHARYSSMRRELPHVCLLYTSDAADDPLCVDLGGRRIFKKKHP